MTVCLFLALHFWELGYGFNFILQQTSLIRLFMVFLAKILFYLNSRWVLLQNLFFFKNRKLPKQIELFAGALSLFFYIGTCQDLFFYCRGRLKSPWSRRKRKHALTPRQWKSLFTPDGKLRDGGVKFLKKVRSGVSYHSFQSQFVFFYGSFMGIFISYVSLVGY